MPLRLRRGTDAERQTITPKEGELIYATDTKEVYIGDGVSQGGSLINTPLANDLFPTLSGDLDLNGNNVIGTGNINIDGTITATGNINLGDGAEDNIIVGGQISSDLLPQQDSFYNLGNAILNWNKVYASEVNVESTINTSNISLDRIYAGDSSLLYDNETDTFSANFEGDIIGSVFGSDSTTLVDAINNSISNGDILFEGTSITPFDNTTISIENGLIIESTTDSSVEGLSLEGNGGPSSTSNIIRFNTFNETGGSPNQAASGTVLSSLQSSAFNGTSFEQSAIMAVVSSDIADETYPSIPSTIFWFTGDGVNSVASTAPASFNSAGVFNAPIFKIQSYTDTSFPTSPEEGWMIFDTTNKQFKGYNGTSWITLG